MKGTPRTPLRKAVEHSRKEAAGFMKVQNQTTHITSDRLGQLGLTRKAPKAHLRFCLMRSRPLMPRFGCWQAGLNLLLQVGRSLCKGLPFPFSCQKAVELLGLVVLQGRPEDAIPLRQGQVHIQTHPQ